MRYDIKERTNFCKGAYLSPLCKVCPRELLDVFVFMQSVRLLQVPPPQAAVWAESCVGRSCSETIYPRIPLCFILTMVYVGLIIC